MAARRRHTGYRTADRARQLRACGGCRGAAGRAPGIVSAGRDSTVRAWRLADGTPAAPPLELPGSVKSVAVHGKVIVTAAGADIAVHELEFPPAPRR
jgi:hypothetical protein